MLPRGVCRTTRASARRSVSCRGVCASSLCPQIPHVPTPTFGAFRSTCLNFQEKVGDRKGTTKKLCDKDFAERSGELSGAIRLKTVVLLENDPVIPSNCSENYLVLFVRFFGFVGPFWLLRRGESVKIYGFLPTSAFGGWSVPFGALDTTFCRECYCRNARGTFSERLSW